MKNLTKKYLTLIEIIIKSYHLRIKYRYSSVAQR